MPLPRCSRANGGRRGRALCVAAALCRLDHAPHCFLPLGHAQLGGVLPVCLQLEEEHVGLEHYSALVPLPMGAAAAPDELAHEHFPGQCVTTQSNQRIAGTSGCSTCVHEVATLFSLAQDPCQRVRESGTDAPTNTTGAEGGTAPSCAQKTAT